LPEITKILHQEMIQLTDKSKSLSWFIPTCKMGCLWKEWEGKTI